MNRKLKFEPSAQAAWDKSIGKVMARDRAMENWLPDQVVPAYDALKAKPMRSRLLSGAHKALPVQCLAHGAT